MLYFQMNRYSKCIATIDEWLEPIKQETKTPEQSGDEEQTAPKFAEKATASSDIELLT